MSYICYKLKLFYYFRNESNPNDKRNDPGYKKTEENERPGSAGELRKNPAGKKLIEQERLK